MILYYNNYTKQQFKQKEGILPVHELYILLSGSFSCNIEQKEFVAQKNDVFYLPKGCYFQREVLTPVHYLYLKFDTLPFSLPPGSIRLCDPARLQSTARYLEQAIQTHNQSEIAHYADDILLLFKHTIDAAFVNENEIARDCNAFLHTNFSNPDLNLENLAARYGLSKNGLINKYKRVYGKTPISDLIDIRINEAKGYLSYHYPIQWIAKHCGFENTYYFSNTFKKKTGLSPTAFRQRLRQDLHFYRDNTLFPNYIPNSTELDLYNPHEKKR